MQYLKIFVYGNALMEEDSKALRISRRIKIKGVIFKEMDAVEDFDVENPVIMDVADTDKVEIITDENRLKQPRLYAAHDFDLAFQLKLLKKAGMIKSFKVIAVPAGVDEERTLRDVVKAIESISSSREENG